ncbi:tol-pal system protein YbgF [Gemmatimonas aurantiaca]|nr:tol-pal system protein YbgF [Gemmatimonas aurantiaca]
MKQDKSHNARPQAATLLLLLALAVAGCATKEDVVKVEERVIALEANLRRAEAGINRVDSLARQGGSGKSGEYAQLQATIQSLADQVEQLTNNVGELQDRLSYLQSQKGSGSAAVVADGSNNTGGQEQSNTPGIDCSKLYDDSFIQIRQREYDAALAGFADYLEFCGGDDRADNAQYWIAEAYYSRKDYKNAKAQYEKLIKTYPSSEKMATAYFKLGRCAEYSGDSKAAQKYFETVTSKYPATQEAQLASEKLIELKGSSANRGD